MGQLRSNYKRSFVSVVFGHLATITPTKSSITAKSPDPYVPRKNQIAYQPGYCRFGPGSLKVPAGTKTTGYPASWRRKDNDLISRNGARQGFQELPGTQYEHWKSSQKRLSSTGYKNRNVCLSTWMYTLFLV